jgi:hypothetical protein
MPNIRGLLTAAQIAAFLGTSMDGSTEVVYEEEVVAYGGEVVNYV